MITTTQEFQDAINSNVRASYAEVTINYTDVTLDLTIEASSTDENYITWTGQAVNGRTDMSYKYVSLDGSCYPDGTYHAAPSTEEEANFTEFGYWSNTIGDSNGDLDVTLTIDYSTRDVSGFYLACDDQREEYAVDFTVKFYSDSTLVDTKTVTGNTEVKYNTSFTQLEDIDQVVLNITKWSAPTTTVKIAEFTTQVIETYSIDELCNFNILEQREISNDNSIPVGNISASQLSLCLINRNRQFDSNNTDSRLYGLVKPNVYIEVSLGCKTANGIETIPCFKGWGSEWSVPETDLNASLSARDRLDLLTQTTITTSTVQENLTFYDWFELVLNDGGLSNTQYNIDSTLDGTNFIIPYGWLSDVTHRVALETLAQGCSAVVYVDRLGIIQVKYISTFDNTLQQTFDRSDYTTKDNQSVYQSIANNITVKTQPLTKVTGQTIYETTDTEKETATANSVETITIYYSDEPATDQVATISPTVSGISITDYTHYSWGSSLEITNTNSIDTDYQVVVTGSIFEVKGIQTATAKDEQSINDNGQNDFSYPTNQFLQKKVLAQNIADTLLASFKNPQRDLSLGFDTGGNPSLELGDRIGVTDLYTTSYYSIIEQEINFDGGLSIAIQGRV